MNVIINQDNHFYPVHSKKLLTQGHALLNFLAVLGYAQEHLPLAAIYKTLLGLDGDWALLTPIYWQVTHNDAMIVAHGDNVRLSDSESKTAFDSLEKHYSSEGQSLFYYDKNTWLINITHKPKLHARSVFHLLNQSLMPELAQLDSTLFWQKWFTECQMLFASQSTNFKMNGIWAWGSGTLAEKNKIAVCVDEAYLPFAKLCCEQVTLYSPDLNLERFQILLLNDGRLLSLKHQQELEHALTCWYWNNSAYSCSRVHWFSRIWRYITHAH